jgi:two-component system response regulator AtoC
MRSPVRLDRTTENRIAVLDDEERASRLALLVMGEAGVFTYPLPERGELTVGRASRCGICIDDPLLSREHALLRVGATLELVDLDSSNGTRIGDRRLAPKIPATLAVGDVISLGSTVMVVQPGSTKARERHLWAHGYFEARLEDECARAEATGRPFAVIRLRAPGSPAAVEDWLAQHLRRMEVVGAYAPGEYEILLPETDKTSALGLVSRLRGELAALTNETAQIGLACYPSSARTPEQLIARAAPGATEVTDSATSPGQLVEGGALERLRPIVERVAAGSIPVLIVGETGVGKDVLASRIHAMSPRAAKPMLCVNCAALPEALLESQLFGYERGAFTGAVHAKPGLLEAAEGGTMFLDEVGEMPLAVQAKLLRVLDQHEVLRVGALKPRRTDVRFLAATNRDLEAEVARGTFREDLFYRLNGVVLAVPPLRERVAEIAPLAQNFATMAARALGHVDDPLIDRDAMDLLERYAWPGNVRELRNVVERAVLLSTGAKITREHLPAEKMGRTLPTRDAQRMRPLSAAPEAPLSIARSEPRNATRDAETLTRPPGPTTTEDDRRRIVAALEECDGNQTHAAKLLGVSRRTLISRLDDYGLPRPRKR